MKLMIFAAILGALVNNLPDLNQGMRLALKQKTVEIETNYISEMTHSLMVQKTEAEECWNKLSESRTAIELQQSLPSLTPERKKQLFLQYFSNSCLLIQYQFRLSQIRYSLDQLEKQEQFLYIKRKDLEKESIEIQKSSAEMNNEGNPAEQDGLKRQAQLNTGSFKNLNSGIQACPADYPVFDEPSVLSEKLMLPLNGTISAGTWAYPGGGMHLGLDVAVPLYSQIRMPANGIVLYASHPVDSNCGYLGNWCGWPNGGGNTICVLCPTEQGLYAISFAHLSNVFYVEPGQSVKKNDVIALSGNSGNSSGPHCHIEVFRLSVSYEMAVEYFMRTSDFAWGCGWNAPKTCSEYGCRISPENVFNLKS